MVQLSHVLLLASLVAASCVLVVRAVSPQDKTPTVLKLVDESALESMALSDEQDVEEEEEGSSEGGGNGLFANNKIRIQDSRIVLTSRDRQQFIQSLAQAMLADQKKAMAKATSDLNTSNGTALVPITRDAFLYLKPVASNDTSVSFVVRLGWRYPLTTWQTYKAFVTTQGCDVQRVVGDFFYC